MRSIALTLLFVLISGCNIIGFDEYEPGLILPNGYNIYSVKNPSGELVSQNAFLRVNRTELPECFAYHALIVRDESDLKAFSTANERWNAQNIVTISWRRPTDSTVVELRLDYDGKAKTVRIGKQVFSTATSNLFLVRLHSDGTTNTQPLNGLLNESLQPPDVLSKFKVITDDPAIRNVELGG